MNGKPPPNLPLSGITVVSLEQAIAAPLASRHLADWGARVIKIERPGKGDFCRDYDYVMNGMSSQFAWTNRSKESLALDVKSSEGKRVLDALLPRADVFLQNLAPGAARRLGLDAATLVALAPPGCQLRVCLMLDCAGLLASLANRLLLRAEMPSPRQIFFWDRVLVPISRVLDTITGRRFGKTVVAVWQRTA